MIYGFKKISRSRRKYLWRCRRKVLKKLYKPFLPEFRRVKLREQADRITVIICAGYEPMYWDHRTGDATRDIATLLAFSAEAFVGFRQALESLVTPGGNEGSTV